MRHARSLVVLASALAILAPVGAASAPDRKSISALDGLNAVRTKLGLSELRDNPISARLVAEIAARAVDDRLPETLDSQPDCAVCQVYFDRRGLSLNPREIYRQRGGDGTLGLALWRAGWTVEQNLSVFFRASAMVLDPRARTFSAARTPRGMLLVAVTIDPREQFRNPIRWPTGLVDPRHQLWVQVVLPPRTGGAPRLLERRGTRDVVVAHPLADTVGLGGARIVGFGLSAVLAYGHRYSARIGPVTVPLQTRTAPEAFLARTWTFSSIDAEQRQAFLALVERSPPLLRQLLSEVDGATHVIGGGLGCHIADACESAENGQATISFHVVEPFVILHELGHVVFDIGLDETGARLFGAAFTQAGWIDQCCVKPAEVFADQLAYWALGGKPPDVRSYTNRMILSPERFEEVLRQNGAYRPVSAVGLLKR